MFTVGFKSSVRLESLMQSIFDLMDFCDIIKNIALNVDCETHRYFPWEIFSALPNNPKIGCS